MSEPRKLIPYAGAEPDKRLIPRRQPMRRPAMPRDEFQDMILQEMGLINRQMAALQTRREELLAKLAEIRSVVR